MDSILSSVKKLLGIDVDYEQFDVDIVMYINSVFAILSQMGVGPSDPFYIQDKTATWDDFFDGDDPSEMVKTYMYMKVRMMFDPPTGAATQATNDCIKELEWRLFYQNDPLDLI